MKVILSITQHIYYYYYYYYYYPLFISLHPKFSLLIGVLLPLVISLCGGLQIVYQFMPINNHWAYVGLIEPTINPRKGPWIMSHYDSSILL